MERSRIAIIIPALNEAATIGAILAQVGEYGTAVVVDDGSTDTTADIARRAGAHVVGHAVNRGYDAALNSGFARAAALGCEYVITMDADGQHHPSQLGDFVRHLDQGCDLVLGSRDRTQRIGESIFAAVGKGLWRIADPLCGMKAYRIGLYTRRGTFDTFRSIGTELAVRSVAGGCKFAALPVLTRDRADSPRFGQRFAANYKILRAMSILVYLHFAKRLG